MIGADGVRRAGGVDEEVVCVARTVDNAGDRARRAPARRGERRAPEGKIELVGLTIITLAVVGWPKSR
jgi:hypothetical protein